MPKALPNRVRVAYYARAAHDSDNTRERLYHQAERARAQIQARADWVLAETTTHIGSGLRVQPCLSHLLDRARAGQFDLLLIERLSDLGRSLGTIAYTLTELQTAGVDLRTLGGERIDTTTGHLITAVPMAVDEYQQSPVTERQKKSRG
ncbi:MAG TPA: recombinase family protein [Actinomycetes bacterium]|jgi:DNA invertase Pin-like site-specific DNA recombinase|nr:recombinase family protein [Actinomycetes bacterium]